MANRYMAGVAVCLLAAWMGAQAGASSRKPGKPQSQPQPQAKSLFERIDADGNGTLSKAEFSRYEVRMKVKAGQTAKAAPVAGKKTAMKPGAACACGAAGKAVSTARPKSKEAPRLVGKGGACCPGCAVGPRRALSGPRSRKGGPSKARGIRRQGRAAGRARAGMMGGMLRGGRMPLWKARPSGGMGKGQAKSRGQNMRQRRRSMRQLPMTRGRAGRQRASAMRPRMRGAFWQGARRQARPMMRGAQGGRRGAGMRRQQGQGAGVQRRGGANTCPSCGAGGMMTQGRAGQPAAGLRRQGFPTNQPRAPQQARRLSYDTGAVSPDIGADRQVMENWNLLADFGLVPR